MGHRFLEHTGEVEVLVEAPTEEAVFAEVTQAFAELVSRGDAGDHDRRTIALSAGDRPSLLVEWTNELVHLAEVDGFVPEAVEEIALEAGSVQATIAGRVGGAPSNLVKAATFSGLGFERADGGWRATIVLDV